MARMPTTADAFNAIAEANRRHILEFLSRGECSVNDVARALSLRQPAASKHLKVLREVGLVRMREAGPQRLYALNPGALKPVHEWLTPFERLWNERFDRLDAYLQELQQTESKENKNAKTHRQ